jgi:16S rRNA processing protein RimM
MKTPPSTQSSPLMAIATVVGVRGVRGQLKLKPNSTPPDWLDRVTTITLKTPTKSHLFTVAQWQWQHPHVLTMLKDLTDRDVAATWVGASVEVPEADLPAPATDEFRTRDLVGKPVWSTLDNTCVATVKGLLFNNERPFLELEGPAMPPTAEGTQPPQIWVIPFEQVFFPTIDADKVWLSFPLSEL